MSARSGRRGAHARGVRSVRAGAAGALALALALGAAGCGAEQAGQGGSGGQGGRHENGAALEASPATAPADAPVRLTVRGAAAKEPITVRSRAEDRAGHSWGAERRFTTDGDGGVELGNRGMQLLSDMEPLSGPDTRKKGSGDAFSFHTRTPDEQRSYEVRLTAYEGGKRVAHTELNRQWLPNGARHRKLTMRADGVDGELYAPYKGAPRKAPVLVFGGSEGGNAGEFAAAVLASHGHPALSVCYFRCGRGSDRPNAIDMIDLDYFTRAAKLLGEDPAADPRRMAVMGNSRGSEAAQLLGQRRPGVFRDVIAYAPSSKVIGPYPTGRAAWADHGKPVPTGPIKLDRVTGKVLAIAGGNDKMWDSAGSAKAIESQGQRQLLFPGAGHHVNWFPYGQPGEDGGENGDVRGTTGSDQYARKNGWPQVLGLLDR
ncbi:hypothetical protein [Streptomyces sp. ODS28]|uniref:alpha/beta hydrolase family protein n=1 Tax=Streptomyces sp. ODS28 TaxID=3136688 RepID=UPI0031EC0358